MFMTEGEPLPIPPTGEGAPGSSQEKGPVLGPEGEPWGDWIVPDQEAYQRWEQIESPELKIEVHLLARRPVPLVTHDDLSRSHTSIENLVRSGSVAVEDAAEWLRAIE